MIILVPVGLAVALVGAAFWILLGKLAGRSGANPPDPAWLSRFSLDTYAPMERLLDRTDFEFLESQPGSSPKVVKRLLRQRRKIFKQYLVLLVRDFGNLVAIGKLLMVSSAEDKAEFGRALFRLQLVFYPAVLFVYCKLAIYPWGWTALDVPRLVHSIERAGDQVRVLAMRHNIAAT